MSDMPSTEKIQNKASEEDPKDYQGRPADRPFQFGQRYLTNEDDVWNHNAWDHVEWGDEQREEAQRQLEAQSQTPVPDFDKNLYNSNPAKYWNQFYSNNREKFFKDRRWLSIEFPDLFTLTKPEAGSRCIVEVGCGAGNTMYPVLEANTNPDLKVVGVDYSSKAVDIVKQNEMYAMPQAHAAVWDLANPDGEMPEGCEEHSVDIIVLIFVLSALSPDQWANAVRNIKKLAKPGAKVLFRDYGRYDLTQIRFKKGRLLDENFYIRGDGTRVYFFTEEEVQDIFKDFNDVKVATDRRLIVNRQRRVKMYRVWLQGTFTVPIEQEN